MISFRLHFALSFSLYQTFETVFHHISKHLEIIENTLFPLGNVVINSVPGIYYTKLCIQFRDRCKSCFWQRSRCDENLSRFTITEIIFMR